ncbi:POP4 [Mytilus coruscus]|uniref:Ribonuclease P protein subunit p29 n=1 Tax=Mytilus coruscus TaxID=42192 RepID=A0A6J8EUN0_MYTCO|nr:POP4 [Mytilus coruscus]
MALYRDLPTHVFENAAAIGLKSKSGVENDFVSAFLQRHLPANRLRKGEDKDLKYKTQNLDKVKKKKPEVINKKRRKGLTSGERKKLKLFDIKKEHQSYEKYIPMHKIWKDYIHDVLNIKSVNKDNIHAAQERLLKADFHGSCLTVQRSKCLSYVGVNGIVLQETRNTFKIITQEDQVKCIPKINSVFVFEIGGYVFTLHGNQFCVRSAERCTRKFKLKGTIEI